jgi:hypothetical protein
MHLPELLQAWDTPDFRTVLKQQVESLPPGQLPLQQGLTQSSYALDAPVTAVLVGSEAQPDRLRLRVGLFYQGIVAGCNCADDPTPVEPQNEYCEVWLEIDRATGEATLRLAE